MANKITYNRGTDFNLGHTYQINGVAATTGITLFFTVKPAVDDDVTDASAILKKNVSMTGANNVIPISRTDISDVNDDANYVYDIKVLDSNLGLQLLDKGVFNLDVSATNRVS